MRYFLWIIDLVVILLSLLWFYESRTFEPIIVGLIAFSGFIVLVKTKPKKKDIMKQKAGRKSKQYQSGGDMTINEK